MGALYWVLMTCECLVTTAQANVGCYLMVS